MPTAARDIETVRIDLEASVRGPTGASVFAQDIRGQWLIVGTKQIGPFDTWQDLMLWASKMAYRAFGPLMW